MYIFWMNSFHVFLVSQLISRSDLPYVDTESFDVRCYVRLQKEDEVTFASLLEVSMRFRCAQCTLKRSSYEVIFLCCKLMRS